MLLRTEKPVSSQLKRETERIDQGHVKIKHSKCQGRCWLMPKVLRSQKALCSVTIFRGWDCCHLNLKCPSRPICWRLGAQPVELLEVATEVACPWRRYWVRHTLWVSLYFLGFITQTRLLWSLFATMMSCTALGPHRAMGSGTETPLYKLLTRGIL